MAEKKRIVVQPRNGAVIGRRITQPIHILSKEQVMLKEMFQGERNWGTGRNLPKLNQALRHGHGLIKSGDMERETAGMFGLK